MTYIRSILFNILFFLGSTFFSLALLWVFFVPRKVAEKYVNIYFKYIDWIERYILNLKLELRGLENLPKDGSFILAAKHQSAYETLKLPIILKDPAVILKRELTYIPVWGWYTKKLGMIDIDRGSGHQAMRSIIRGALRVKEEGRPIIIFPQGTRVAPDVKKPYKSGMLKIYKETQLPIIPMAINSGVFWGKNSFIKRPGTVVFKFLPPISTEKPQQDIMHELEDTLEQESDKLVQEAREQL